MNIQKAVEDSILDLINQYRLDDITIALVCSHAAVSKTSFYRYYTDKYDLVNKTFDGIMPEGLEQIGRNMSWSEGLNLIFDALGRQRNFFRQAYISGDFNNLENHTQSFFKKLLVTAVDNQRGDSEDDDISFSIDLYAVSLAHFFKEWVQKGGTDTKENLIAHLRDSSPEILFGYLA
jgi:AcrR family transcriptional regulator